MGFRFQKRIRILPGITLNLSKKGVSTSIGTRGARVTLGHGKTRTTVGIPGSGLSHTTITSNKRKSRAQTLASTPPGDRSFASKVVRFALYALVSWVTFSCAFHLGR